MKVSKLNVRRFAAKAFSVVTIAAMAVVAASAQKDHSKHQETTQSNDAVWVGPVESIDGAAQTVTVKTKDGTTKVYKFAKDSTLEGLDQAAFWTKKSGRVVIRSSEAAGESTIKTVRWLGDEGEEVGDATVRVVKKGGNKFGVKVGNAAEEVYDASEDAVIWVGGKAVKLAEFTGDGAKKGAKATVHYTTVAGKKVINFITED